MLTPAHLDRHLAAAMGVLVEHAGDAGLEVRRDQVVITAVGHGPDEFNTAWVLGLPAAPGPTLGWAQDQLASRGLPFMLQVPEEVATEVDSTLRGLGLEAGHAAPGMVRAIPAAAPAPPRGLRVEHVRDRFALQAHVVALARGFGAVDGSAMEGVMPSSLLEDDRVVCLNGHVNGAAEPSATAISVAAEGVAGIYGVTVQESARRRGFGAAMTWAAMAAAARQGLEAAVLQASPMGHPVYERMGFSQIRTHRRYRPAVA